MVQIISEGRVPNTEFRADCPKCSTAFTFLRDEAERVFDSREGNYLTIKCPLDGCNYIVTQAE